MAQSTTKVPLKQVSRDEAREALLKMLQPGDTVYTILRHVSRSGMVRYVEPIILREYTSFGEGGVQPLSIGGRVSTLLDRRTNGEGAVKMRGCGMDMGFALVYELADALWPSDQSHIERDGEPATGGYSLNHRQLDDLAAKDGDTLEGLIGYLLRKTLGLQGG